MENRKTALASAGKKQRAPRRSGAGNGITMETCYRVTNGELRLDIKALPGASKTAIAGIKDQRLRVRIAAAPEDGKANAELIAFLARTLGCAKRDLRLASGEKSRLKTIAMPPGYELQLKQIISEVS
jgi:uncharacterized protein (TIGR00251 family)